MGWWKILERERREKTVISCVPEGNCTVLRYVTYEGTFAREESRQQSVTHHRVCQTCLRHVVVVLWTRWIRFSFRCLLRRESTRWKRRPILLVNEREKRVQLLLCWEAKIRSNVTSFSCISARKYLIMQNIVQLQCASGYTDIASWLAWIASADGHPLSLWHGCTML